MNIKNTGLDRSALIPFDLLGTDEVGLSKAFAYTLGKEPSALYSFLHFIGLKTNHTKANFQNISIETERVRDEGRTDIEIKQARKFHVIIECKVRSSKVHTQRTQYLNSFDNVPQKVLCFITREHDFKKQLHNDIQIHNLGWIDIINLFDNKLFLKNKAVQDFSKFAMKGFKMKEQKEILVQDLGDPNEIKRFREFQVYRRDVISGSPLYFSPYFTRSANQPEGGGLSYLSKILGILTVSPKDILNFKDDLSKFAGNPNLVEKWIAGVKLDKKENEKTFTYFFLAEPLRLNVPLIKDGTNKKGRGKNWIAAMIPKNRCVTFEEFTRRLMEKKNG
jgi:hypothetical protein